MVINKFEIFASCFLGSDSIFSESVGGDELVIKRVGFGMRREGVTVMRKLLTDGRS